MDEHLEKLKHQWRQTHLAQQKWQQLIRTREQLELNEERLIQEIENEHFSEHDLDEKKRLLREIQRKKQDLDHLLDTLEEHTEEREALLYQQIIQTVLKLHPEEENTYLQLKQDQDKLQASINELLGIIEIGTSLSQLLEFALQERQSIKKMGIFRYIFGNNPNTAISQYLHAAGELSEKVLSSVKGKETVLGQETAQEFLSFLQELRLQCKQRWGFKHLDTTCTRSLKRMNSFLSTFQEKLINLEEENQKIKAKIIAFIEKY